MALPQTRSSIDRDFARRASAIVARINSDSCLQHVQKLAPAELEALIYCILRHLARWSNGERQQLDPCITLIRNVCFVRSIPSFEASELVYAIRDSILEDLRFERLRAGSDDESEGPFDASDRFFDLLAFELIKGY